MGIRPTESCDSDSENMICHLPAVEEGLVQRLWEEGPPLLFSGVLPSEQFGGGGIPCTSINQSLNQTLFIYHFTHETHCQHA